MMSRFVAMGLAAALVAAALPVAYAQFADETESLFTGDPDAPATKNDLLIFELDNDDADQAVSGSGAQSVEAICCQMTAEERKTDGLCFEVQCPDDKPAGKD